MGRQQRRRNDRRKQRPQQNQGQRSARSTSGKSPSATPRAAGRNRSLGGRVGIWIGILIVVLAVAGIIATLAHSLGSSATTTPTPTHTSNQVAAGQPVDGIQCNGSEVLVYHIHQHIALYDHGRHIDLPSEIGIPGGEQAASCYYWIHVHAYSPNIIHVESPLKKTFTVGALMDIWKVTKDSASPAGDAYVLSLQAAAKRGQVTAFYNGNRWRKGYRSIPLTAHAVITVEIGTPVIPPRPFTNWQGL